MSTIGDLLERLWTDYRDLNPQARAIHALLESRGERVVNDHIALRTYEGSHVGLEKLARAFVRLGYEPKGEYAFPEKKLFARHFEHADASLPRIFISELKVREFPPAVGRLIERLIEQAPQDRIDHWTFPVAGRPWTVSWEEYEFLRSRSEYAAWVAAFGFRANHFTVLVNALCTFQGLAELNAFLKASNFSLNAAGGEIKGSREVFLEQSSTLADQVDVTFADGVHRIPACYYEFALRHRLPDGTLYGGFVEKSADKIFESTNVRG